MKTITALVIALACAGCRSPIARHAYRSDPGLEFLVGRSNEVAIPIERVDGNGGRVATAHLRAYGRNVYLFGTVERLSLFDPPPGSHLEIMVIDRRNQVVEATPANYLPRDIPHGQRGAFPRSQFAARLAACPPPGSMVKVIFRGAHKSECDCAARRVVAGMKEQGLKAAHER